MAETQDKIIESKINEEHIRNLGKIKQIKLKTSIAETKGKLDAV